MKTDKSVNNEYFKTLRDLIKTHINKMNKTFSEIRKDMRTTAKIIREWRRFRRRRFIRRR